MTVDEFIADFEKALELERELGVRKVELDRSLLTAPVPAPLPLPTRRIVETVLERVPRQQAKEPKKKVPQTELVFVVADEAELSGKAGDLLDKMQGAMGFTRAEAPVLVTKDGVMEAVTALGPKVVVICGRDAARKFLPNQRCAPGVWTSLENGMRIVSIPAPAYMLRFFANDPEGLQKQKLVAWNTLKSVLAMLGRKPPERKR